MNFFNTFSWLAADLQLLLMCRLNFSLSFNNKTKTFADDTALIC